MLPIDVRVNIIRPSLQAISTYSPDAEVLVFGTALIETSFNYLYQIGMPQDGGLGFWQCEPTTYLDHVKWLKRPENKVLSNSILATCFYDMFPTDPLVLAYNIKFACLICRVHYLRIAAPIPKDPDGKANYYKTYYNSSFGAAQMPNCIKIFEGISND